MSGIFTEPRAATILSLASLFISSARCQAQQTVARTSEQWIVEGTVTDGTQPVPGAEVWCQGQGQARSARSDERGQYSFNGGFPGTIKVGAEKAGYGAAAFRTVSVRPGALPERIDIAIHREGVVSGRVLDPSGDAMQGAQVVLWAKVFKNGKGGLAYRGVADTNDLGEYRIAGIAAGRYFLEALPKAAEPHKAMPPVLDRAAKSTARLGIARKVFYPNANSIDAASPIEVGSGQQVEGTDIRFGNAETFCVTAKVIANDSVIALRETPESGGASVSRTRVKAGEMFEICGLPSAQYRITVMGVEPQGTQNDNVVAFSRTDFTIADRNVALGTLPSIPTAPLSGTVSVLKGSSAAALPTGLMARLKPPDDRSLIMSESSLAKVGSSGAFEFPNVFSDSYSLWIPELPRGYYVKQFTQGGRDVRFGGVRGGAGPVSILLGADGAILDGQVADKDSLPVPDAVVALMPKHATAGAEILTQSTDQNGRFTFSADVAPGDYYVIAFSHLIEGQGQNLEFMRGNADDAQEITLGPNANQHVPLTVQRVE
jgi:hypothetical protein